VGFLILGDEQLKKKENLTGEKESSRAIMSLMKMALTFSETSSIYGWIWLHIPEDFYRPQTLQGLQLLHKIQLPDLQ